MYMRVAALNQRGRPKRALQPQAISQTDSSHPKSHADGLRGIACVHNVTASASNVYTKCRNPSGLRVQLWRVT
jgi:hypothetical protein